MKICTVQDNRGTIPGRQLSIAQEQSAVVAESHRLVLIGYSKAHWENKPSYICLSPNEPPHSTPGDPIAQTQNTVLPHPLCNESTSLHCCCFCSQARHTQLSELGRVIDKCVFSSLPGVSFSSSCIPLITHMGGSNHASCSRTPGGAPCRPK